MANNINKHKSIPIGSVGFDIGLAQWSESDFVKFCEKRNFEGDAKKAYAELRAKAGLPVKEKKEVKEKTE